jgi:hypothetical protein
MAVDPGVEYARSCRLADGRGNSGDRRVSVVFDIDTSVVNELPISDNWHTDGDRHGSALNQADKPMSVKRGAICEKVA